MRKVSNYHRESPEAESSGVINVGLTNWFETSIYDWIRTISLVSPPHPNMSYIIEYTRSLLRSKADKMRPQLIFTSSVIRCSFKRSCVEKQVLLQIFCPQSWYLVVATINNADMEVFLSPQATPGGCVHQGHRRSTVRSLSNTKCAHHMFRTYQR